MILPPQLLKDKKVNMILCQLAESVVAMSEVIGYSKDAGLGPLG